MPRNKDNKFTKIPPKDLGLKVGSPEMALWKTVRDNVKMEIKNAENGLVVNRELLAVAERKLAEETEKFKK